MLVMTCRSDVGRGMMTLPSHAGDGVVKTTLAVVRYRYRVVLVMALSS
jgi:hypothetical protein